MKLIHVYLNFIRLFSCFVGLMMSRSDKPTH